MDQLSCAQFFELAESEICEDQPEPVVAEYDGELNGDDDDNHANDYDKLSEAEYDGELKDDDDHNKSYDYG